MHHGYRDDRVLICIGLSDWLGAGRFFFFLGGRAKPFLLSHARPRLVQAPPQSPPTSRAGAADLSWDSAPRRLSVDLIQSVSFAFGNCQGDHGDTLENSLSFDQLSVIDEQLPEISPKYVPKASWTLRRMPGRWKPSLLNHGFLPS